MPAWTQQLSLMAGRRAVVLGLAAALLISACTESSVAEPSDAAAVTASFDGVSVPAGTSIGEALSLPGGSALSRPEFSLTTEVSGEWIGERLLDARGKVVAFVDADDGPLALVQETQKSRRVRPYALTDEGWQPTASPTWDPPDESWWWQQVSSVIAIDGTVVAVGSDEGATTDRPLSFVVGGDEIVERDESSTAGWTSVVKSVAGGGTAIAIGERDGRAAAWRSSDGLDWSEVSLPFVAGGSMQLIDVVFADDRWVILGERIGEFVVMVGQHTNAWQTSVLTLPPDISKVVGTRLGHHGSSLHVIGRGRPRVGSATNNPLTWTSTDGATWSAARSGPAEVFGDGYLLLRRAQSTSEATVFIGSADYRSDYRYCFEVETPCAVSVAALWVPDGASWSMLVPPDGVSGWTAAAIIDGTLYVGTGQGVAIYQWSPDTDGVLPRAVPLQIQPPAMTLPLAWEARRLEPGVMYAWSLSLRQICPIVADETWRLDEVSEQAADIIAGSHASIDGEVYGTAELVDRNRIEFAIPGYGPVAYFELLPSQAVGADCRQSGNL